MRICVLILFFSFLACSEHNITEHEIDVVEFDLQVDGIIPIEEKIECTLIESNDGTTNTYEGKVKRRGGFSIRFNKHSYSLDLKGDFPVGGMSSDDDWILNANYIDKTFLRHTFAYDLFRNMHHQHIASNYRYAELHLNGVYNGFYVLMEKLDKSTFFIDESDESAFIFKEPHIFRKSYEYINPEDEHNFHDQKFPKISQHDKTNLIDSLRLFMLESSDERFEQSIRQIFDLENIIDWHLLLLLTNNNDGILKNFYLYKIDQHTGIRVAPWDYDHSLGRDGDNELNLIERPADINRSVLFARLLMFDWYKEAVKNRWNVLNRDGLFQLSELQNRIIAEAQKIKAHTVRNFEVWPVQDLTWYFDDNDFDDELQIILQYLELRHAQLSTYFNEL